MKLLKNGFTALIAIVALGLTIAAQAGAFEKAQTAIANCYVGDPSIEYAPTACDEALLTVNVTDCPITSLTDKPVLNTAVELISGDPACPGGAKFCCATFKLGENQCPSQLISTGEIVNAAGSPIVGPVVIDQVFCRTF